MQIISTSWVDLRSGKVSALDGVACYQRFQLRLVVCILESGDVISPIALRVVRHDWTELNERARGRSFGPTGKGGDNRWLLSTIAQRAFFIELLAWRNGSSRTSTHSLISIPTSTRQSLSLSRQTGQTKCPTQKQKFFRFLLPPPTSSPSVRHWTQTTRGELRKTITQRSNNREQPGSTRS